jgi:hypothetical protein
MTIGSQRHVRVSSPFVEFSSGFSGVTSKNPRECDEVPSILNCIREKIERRLTSGNACCHSFHNSLYSHLLSINVATEICSFVWARNLVSDMKGRLQTECV